MRDHGVTPNNAGAVLRVRMLGGFQVTIGARVVAAADWRLAKARALVKLLALTPAQRLPREQVMEALWPDADLEAAQRNFSYALHVARRALDRDERGRPRKPSLLLLAQGVLSLSPPGDVLIDTVAFTAAAAAAHERETPGAYREALAWYGGELLPDDRYEDWAAGPREMLRERHHRLLFGAARLSLAAGDYVAARGFLQDLLASAPDHEEAHVALMQLYERTGQTALALRQYEALCAALQEALGVEPSATSRRLHAALRAAANAPADDPPASPTSPATPSGQGNLPAALTPFLGRTVELAELAPLLDPARPRTRLVTLVGAGGCGKTRLALEAAERAASGYPDGIWWVDLAAQSNPERLPGVLAQALNLRAEPGHEPLAGLTLALRQRALLIVLDNCEHLLDACADLVAALLAACPRVRVLATSRESLRVPGEVAWRVPSLALPPVPLPAVPSDEQLRATASTDAVRFFLECLALHGAATGLTAANAPAVVAVCSRLDGLPLALELAAARVPALGLVGLAARLDDALHLLGGARRGGSPRQRTLRATLEWSHNLLSAAEACLLRRLAVFVDGCTIAAAEAVCGWGAVDPDDVTLLLVQLVERSLVVAAHSDGEIRYRLLETVRQYARERLDESGEMPEMLAAHARYFGGLASVARPLLTKPEQRAWLDRLDVERHNLRAAIGWATDARQFAIAAQIGADLQYFWYIRGYYHDGYRLLIRLLSLLDEQDATLTPDERMRIDREARVPALRGAGRLAYWAADYAGARQHLEQLLALVAMSGDSEELLACLLVLGNVANHLGQHDVAQRHFTSGLELARERELSIWIGKFTAILGNTAILQADYGAARAWLHQSLPWLRRQGDLVDLSSAMDLLSSVALAETDLAEAQVHAEESLALARQVGARRAEVWAITALGHIAGAHDNHAVAHGHFIVALRFAYEQGAWWHVASCFDGLANLAAKADQVERALCLRAAAEGLRERLGIAEVRNWAAHFIPAVVAMRQRVDPALDAAIRLAARQRPLEEAIGEALGAAQPG